MKCKVSWTGRSGTQSKMGFVAETGSGHVLNMDGAPDAGGANMAARPMELLLAGAGGCSSFDVVMILKKGRHDIHGCTVDIQAERAEADPKVFTKIHMHFTVSGKGLNPTAVERAVQLSHEKYCSATIMLGQVAQVSTSFEVLEVA